MRLLSTFHCAVPSLKWAYRAPNLRNVFANIAQTRGGDLGAVTKVAIDAKGLMKVTHMLRVATAVDGYQDVATHPLASAGTQAEAATAQRLAVAQFALLPLTDEGADADEEESRGVDLTDGDAMTF